MSDDVECMKHRSATVPVGEDPEHGTIYRCPHDPDHHVAAPVNGIQAGWTTSRPPASIAPECAVFHCLAEPTAIVTHGEPRLEHAVCAEHERALATGEPWSFHQDGKMLMGDDYRIANGG
jgi:hypothetical protein